MTDTETDDTFLPRGPLLHPYTRAQRSAQRIAPITAQQRLETLPHRTPGALKAVFPGLSTASTSDRTRFPPKRPAAPTAYLGTKLPARLATPRRTPPPRVDYRNAAYPNEDGRTSQPPRRSRY